MEIGSSTQEEAWLLMARNWWAELMGLPGKFKVMVMDLARNIKKVAREDPRRVTHAIKEALALIIAALVCFIDPLYRFFGNNGLWTVVTIIEVFEFSVGATLSKALNRGIATLIAGAIGVGGQILLRQAILIEICVFLLATVCTFLRFLPRIKATYDLGFAILILTFTLVAVAGYHVDILQFTFQRILTTIIGEAICLLISIFLRPVWAGEDLHKLVVLNIDTLGSYLEGVGGKYFQVSEDGGSVGVSEADKLFLEGYKSVLDSKATEEELANFARWEPGHGRFRFHHPWKQYLEIGELTRQCDYQIKDLNSCINSWIQLIFPNLFYNWLYGDHMIQFLHQAPEEFRTKFIQESCRKMSSESGKALKKLSSAMGEMKYPSSAYPHIQNSKQAMEELIAATSFKNADLLTITTLMKIVSCVEKIDKSVHELSRLAHFEDVDHELTTITPEKPVRPGSVKPVSKLDGDEVGTVTQEKSVQLDDDQENIKPCLDGDRGDVAIAVREFATIDGLKYVV